MKTYYDILGVTQDAEPELIHAAFRAKSKLYHPDLSSSPSDEMMKKINRANDCLSSSSRRKDYDKKLHDLKCDNNPSNSASSSYESTKRRDSTSRSVREAVIGEYNFFFGVNYTEIDDIKYDVFVKYLKKLGWDGVSVPLPNSVKGGLHQEIFKTNVNTQSNNNLHNYEYMQTKTLTERYKEWFNNLPTVLRGIVGVFLPLLLMWLVAGVFLLILLLTGQIHI